MISGVVVSPLKTFADERGAVLHMLRSDAPHFHSFGEIYFSITNPGVVKAWRRHHQMVLNLACISGVACLAIYDDRPGSRTHGIVQEVLLGIAPPATYALVTVPPGVWAGFACRSTMPAIIANCASIPHDPSEADSLPADTDQIPYRWAA